VAYCYKCDSNLNELLIELQADEKLANNPLTIKLEYYLENIPVIIHTWQQRLIKKRPENLNDRVMLADPYKDDYLVGRSAKTNDYLEEKNNEATRKPNKAKNPKLQRNLVNFPEKIFGLANNDNTCFMAVILQCLNGNVGVAEYYIGQNEYFATNVDKMKLSYAFSNFLINSRRSKTNTGLPSEIYLHFQEMGVYVKGQQADALLFYYCLVDGLMEETKLMNTIQQKDSLIPCAQSNFIDQNISSKLLNFSKCLNCDFEKYTYDRQITLSIALDESGNGEKGQTRTGDKKSKKKEKRKNKNRKPDGDADFEENFLGKPKKDAPAGEKGGFSVLDD
jgi:hypothetical protein